MEFQKIREIISRILDIPQEEIGESVRFAEDLHADSMELFQILVETEKVFDTRLSFAHIDTVRTPKDLMILLAES